MPKFKNMNLDRREIEIKFKISNPKLIQKILKDVGAQFVGKAFERTVRFDTPDMNLEKKGKFLRIRTGFKNTITLKQRVKNKRFKEREEIELEISNPEKMKVILDNLGFTKVLIMEKYREKWKLNNTEIVIDRLPMMGTFIEIEGNEKSIKEIVRIFGLNLKNGVTATYWDLWKEFSKKEGIKNENIVFHLDKK